MKTLKNLLLSLFVMASIGSMAQNEIKMHTGTVNIGEGKTYYFFDSGGEEEFTVEEDPNNDYRWKTWYNHNEVYTLTFKVPENSTKGIKVTFRSLLINNDHLIIYEGNPGDSLDMSKRIVDLTNNDYSTDYSTFTVMSHGNMNIRFRADGHWRDAGWEAVVELDDFAPQAPVVMRKACDNQLVILPTCNGCSIYYNMSTGTPNDPTNASTSYTIGNTIDALTTYPFTMKAIAYIDNVASGIGSQTITSEIAAPVFTNTANTDYEAYYTYNPTDKTNTITINTNRDPNINDTYYARYIINDTADHNNCTYSITHSDKYQEMENPGGTIDYTNTTLTPDFYVHMLIRGTTCPDKFSAIQTVKVEHIYIPKPEITFDNSGSTTITSVLPGASIYYTTDGSEPTTSSNEYEGAFNVTAGTTVKAIAVKTGYENSETVCEIFSTGSGVNTTTGVVLLDDREDHSWSYYSDGTQPIHSLKPADVKITYTGYGENTMTGTNTDNMPANAAFTEDVESSQVAVNVGETENQFIYLKTLENANEDGSGNYPYTMIPNPFQVRPAVSSGTISPTVTVYQRVTSITAGKKYLIVSQSNTGTAYALGHNGGNVASDQVTIVSGSPSNYIAVADVDATSVWTAGSGYTFQNGNYYIRHNNNNNLSIATNNNNNSWDWSSNNNRLSYSEGGWFGSTYYLRYNNNSWSVSTTTSSSSVYLFEETTTGGEVTGGDYRGFYAWRVKSMSSGLSITDGTNTYGVNSIIYPDQEIEFVTANAKGNEVEFEALWAKAWVNDNSNRASNDGNYQNAYERNFKVGNSVTTYNYPVTLSTILPDGSGTVGTVTLSSDYTCTNDVKFENITFGGNTTRTFTAAGNNLIFGRGITGTSNSIKGIGNSGENLNYTIRVESGTYTNFALMNQGSASCSGINSAKAILGNDYDRAKKDNSKLSITGTMYGGSNNHAFSSSSNRNNLTFDWLIKSGTFQGNVGTATADQSIYFGTPITSNTNNAVQYQGRRRLTMEGGSVANIAGGVNNSSNNYSNYGVDDNSWTVMVRMKGGSVRGSIYGAAAYAGASGDRRFVFTGGNVAGWIAGGCNGTETDGGELYGNTYIYFGGKAQCNSNGSNTTIGPGQATGGNIFGAGSGNSGATGDNATVGRVNSSTIVIADKAVVERNVYGGGNYGYVRNGETNKSDIYVLGGEVKGSVFGGSNMQKGQNVNITMNDGVVGNVYGGSNTQGTINYKVTMNINGGEVTGNVHGGGYGNQTRVSGDIDLTIGAENAADGPTIGGDVYGGSALGLTNTDGGTTASANKNTHVIVNAGKITGNVYGGGLGNNSYAANVGTVTVDINGGTMNKVFGCNNLSGAPQGEVTVNFNGGEAVDVYGGGNEADYLPNATLFPIVNITGGKVTNNVYGGGAFAKVNKTIVNMTGGEASSVYAGAQGNDKSKTLVNGNKTVNMQGGTAIMVYGGSFTCQDVAKSFVNISGGRVKTHVFGSGYFGDMNGDCYVYIGKNAIEKAPYNGDNGDKFKTADLSDEKPIWIESNVYAGANWGSFEGTFGEATITGASNIYIDGTGYNMEHGKNGNYMIIGGSVYGSGTSCAAGTTDHSIIVRKYGNMTYPSMTRSLRSIQRASNLILDESNIDFTGQGDISSMDPTVEYGICNIETIYATNVNNMALSKPMDNVNKLGSYTCADVYATEPSFTTNGYATPKNGIVINNGGYLMVRYDTTINNEPKKCYGALEGFFYMREPGDDAGINNEGYIFARPKYIQNEGSYYWSNTTPGPSLHNVNAGDGGFVAFTDNSEKNIFDANGNEAPQQQGYMRKGYTAPSVQMAYTNRTEEPQAENDVDPTTYRFWRYDPEADYPIVTREVVFVVKADEDASSESTKFLTTTGSVQLPPSLGNDHKYYISGLTWGADGKDCNPANITKTGDETTAEWKYYDEGAFKVTNDSTKNADGTTNTSLEEYYSNPNSTFGFLMRFDGNFKSQDAMILDNNSFQNYFNERAHALAEVDAQNSTDLPELDFLVTYSDRLSQNEMWAEARMVIDEVDPTTGKIKQRIYLNISVTTVTKFGQDVETYVYASTAGTQVTSYTAQLNLPTFALADNTKFYATFTVDEASKSTGFGTVGNTTIQLVDYNTNNVSGSINLALQFNAESNEDKTNGWYHKGDAQNPNQPEYFDFNKVLANPAQINNGLVGASDGRKYTTIAFDLLYDPTKLKTVPEFGIGQKHVGDLNIKMVVDNIEGGVNTFNITIHVYVTGPTKFYYLDGVEGKDGNSGMFPDKAKKTLNGVLNASGYTVEDPIFVVNGVTPKAGASLTWNANKFLNSVTVPEEDQNKYTEEQLRQLSQVKVYRYPGSHPKEDGETISTNDFYNGMYTGQIINVPAGTQFAMHNVCLSGGSDLDNNKDYNPNEETMEAAYPLISIGKGSIVSIENSSLLYNNNTSTTAIAGAIYNEGTLTVNGVHISNNTSAAESGKGTGVYQAGEMNLGNTQMITIADQIYLDDKKIMNAPHGKLFDGSKFSDILVYSEYTPIDTAYSGRVIVRYIGYEPSAPEAPYWKANLPERQSSILKSRKDATEESYESDKYLLNSTLSGFEKANGGDENVIPFITYKMKEQFDPISSSDIIMYTNQANLPVELLYFTAECMGEATQLQWSTASETNNEYFTIERSSDAVNYEEVARIQGAGTTSQRSDYSFMVDNNSNAITYYRLRQTDIDGKYEIFAPIAIQCQNNKAATEISIYPVPANDQVNIFSSNSPMTRIEIYSIMGAKVAEEPAEGNQTTLHIGNLATGVYAVKVFTEDGQVSNVRLIKK